MCSDFFFLRRKKILHYWCYCAPILHMRGAFKCANISMLVVSIIENQLNVALNKEQLKTKKAINASEFSTNQ